MPVTLAPRSSGLAGGQIAITRPALDPDSPAEPSPYAIAAEIMVPNGTMAGQRVTGLDVRFDGEALGETLTGTVTGDGRRAGASGARRGRYGASPASKRKTSPLSETT